MNLQKIQEVVFEKEDAMSNFEFMLYYFTSAPQYVKFYFDQTNCKWAYSNMSNVTM